MPGKKPARIAGAGNALQFACNVEEFVWTAEGLVTAGAVGVPDALDITETTVGVDVPIIELV
jgi:hypothetical protein